MKKFIYLCAVVASATFTVNAPAQDLGIRVGKRAPAAIVQDLNGKPVDLGAFIGKTPMLIEFWATWCSSCMKLEPSIVAAETKYGKRLKIVSVAVSVNQSPERVRLHAKKHGLKHTVVYDATGDATEAYEVPATSYIVVVNKKGNVVYTGLGGDQNIEAALKRAL